MFINIVLSILGFVALIKCADFFVDGAVALAKNFKVSPTVIGLTIVAFGTSAPEMAISFNSHLSDNKDMLFGNVLGSNIANILVILGLAAVIRPLKIPNGITGKQIPLLLLVTLGVSVLFLDTLFDSAEINSLARTDGIILILFFSIFVYYLLTMLKVKEGTIIGNAPPPKYKLPASVAIIAGSLAGIIIGSNLVVTNVSAFAEAIGISQKIISVTVVSIGTSLPELVTTVTAAKKGENNMAMGNIVGSNIFNTCIVLGMPIVILGEASTNAFGVTDIGFMIVAVLLLWVFSISGREIKRHEGAVLLIGYCLYVGYILF